MSLICLFMLDTGVNTNRHWHLKHFYVNIKRLAQHLLCTLSTNITKKKNKQIKKKKHNRYTIEAKIRKKVQEMYHNTVQIIKEQTHFTPSFYFTHFKSTSWGLAGPFLKCPEANLNRQWVFTKPLRTTFTTAQVMCAVSTLLLLRVGSLCTHTVIKYSFSPIWCLLLRRYQEALMEIPSHCRRSWH